MLISTKLVPCNCCSALRSPLKISSDFRLLEEFRLSKSTMHKLLDHDGVFFVCKLQYKAVNWCATIAFKKSKQVKQTQHIYKHGEMMLTGRPLS